MIDADARREIVDGEHLRLLSLGFYVSAAMTAFFSLFGLLYAGMGIAVESAIRTGPRQTGPQPPEGVGWIFVAFGCAMFLGLAAVAAAKFYAARSIAQRRHRIACCVVAALSCIELPYGTALGVAAFLVLSRPSIVPLFGPNAS